MVSVFTVGKTSLITRFMYDSFDNTYQVSLVRARRIERLWAKVVILVLNVYW